MRWAKRLALAGLLGLLLAELGARLFVVDNTKLVWRPMPPFGALTNEAQHEWVARRRAELAGEAVSFELGAFDAELGWTLLPSRSAPGASASTNSRAARGPHEVADEKPAGTLRVACFGESFTFCEEVGDAETWPAQLEARLGTAEVLNFGVGAYGTDQALLRFRRTELPQGVDVLLIGFLLENAARNVNRYRPRYYPPAFLPVPKPRFLLENGALQLLPQPYTEVAELVAALESEAVLTDLAVHEYWDDVWVPSVLKRSALARLAGGYRGYLRRDPKRFLADLADEPARVTFAILETFVTEARARGIARACVLVFPPKRDFESFRGTGERHWEGFVLALEERGLDVLDLAPALAAGSETRAGEREGLYRLSHLSPRGNELVASAVQGWLEAGD